jgi:hypothetical protein
MKAVYYLSGANQSNLDEVNRFNDVLILKYDCIFYRAQRELRRNSLRQPEAIPVERDVESFRNCVVHGMQQMQTTY